MTAELNDIRQQWLAELDAANSEAERHRVTAEHMHRLHWRQQDRNDRAQEDIRQQLDVLLAAVTGVVPRLERLEALFTDREQRLESIEGLMAQSVEDRAGLRSLIEALTERVAGLEDRLLKHVEAGDAP